MDRRVTPERLTREDGSPVRVLVVDDEPMLGDLLSTALRYEGWQVETALNGRTAVRTATSLDPDVVVLDVMLPDMSGLDVLRRTGATTQSADAHLVVGDLMLDEDSHEVFRAGAEIHLTATEFELLRYFMRNPRRVLSKAQILDRVWQYDFGGQANIVELYVSYLRRKIDTGRAPMIHTLRGAGYVLKPADAG